MALKIAIIIFLLLMIVMFIALGYLIFDMLDKVNEMHTAYNSFLKMLTGQVNSTFDKWEETIKTLDESIELNNKLIECLDEAQKNSPLF